MSEILYGDTVNLLSHPAEALLYPDFFSKEESDLYFQLILQQSPWKQEPIKLFGRSVMQPRLTAYYGDEGVQYSYSGVTMHPEQWTETLQEIKLRLERKFITTFNAALLNYYRDGNDAMGWHRDNEKELGKYPVIASVSLGEPRIFQFRSYEEKMPIVSVELNHGSVLLMRGETQQYWEHQLPRTKKVKSARVNLTFRFINA